MPDIKFDQLNERPAVPAGQLEKSLDRLAGSERADNFAIARKEVISEIEQTDKDLTAVGPASIIMAPLAKQQKQVENILAEDLTEIYLGLTPPKRQEFKRVGEETAKQISRLLDKARVNIGQIIKLIKKWLALIPGINKYFLEQEAKIKADEIIKMTNDKFPMSNQ